MKIWFLVGLCFYLPSEASGYTWIKGTASYPAPCPGRYCGRTQIGDGNYSTCGSCPRGSKVLNPEKSSLCSPCTQNPSFYDQLYLAFIVVTSLLSHWVAIDYSAKRNRFTLDILVLHGSALVETAAAALGALLVSQPVGQLSLYSCSVTRLSDWYPVFFNPVPNYEEKLYCTQEIVFPLYSIVFIFYFLSLLALLVVRPCLSSKFLPGRGRNSVYAALYFLPGYALLHALLGGLIYYSFSYIIIILSLISCAAHLAFKLDQTLVALVTSTVKDTRNLVILLGHWCLHAYGIIAVTQLKAGVYIYFLQISFFPPYKKYFPPICLVFTYTFWAYSLNLGNKCIFLNVLNKKV